MKSSDKKEMNVQFVINTQEEEATWDTATTRDSDIPWDADTLWAYVSVQDGAIPAVENLCNTYNRWEAIDKRDNRLVALAQAGDTDAMTELAHRMGISRQAVSQHHARCKKKLRYLLLETKLF